MLLNRLGDIFLSVRQKALFKPKFKQCAAHYAMILHRCNDICALKFPTWILPLTASPLGAIHIHGIDMNLCLFHPRKQCAPWKYLRSFSDILSLFLLFVHSNAVPFLRVIPRRFSAFLIASALHPKTSASSFG